MIINEKSDEKKIYFTEINDLEKTIIQIASLI